MHDLDRALSDIAAIREQMARGVLFRGYGPAALAVTGLLALLAAAIQAYGLTRPTDLATFLAVWIATAVGSVIVIGIEATRRSRQAHGGLADDMLRAAVKEFLPATVAGVLLTLVMVREVPGAAWMLPSLWQIIFSLGIFAACRSLPRPLIAVGIWYLATGLICLGFADGANALSPWAMGFPFGIGQLLSAALFRQSYSEAEHEE